jgi:hypothetical protein
MQRSGCWLSVEEIEAMLSIIPRVKWEPTPRLLAHLAVR